VIAIHHGPRCLRSREATPRGVFVIPAQAGIQRAQGNVDEIERTRANWMPACAGMTAGITLAPSPGARALS